jgi:hypothetical protein
VGYPQVETEVAKTGEREKKWGRGGDVALGKISDQKDKI